MIKKVDLTVEIPNWARWLAVDSNGCIYVYVSRPCLLRYCWVGRERWELVGKLTCFPSGWDWKKTLRQLKDYR